MSTQVSFLFEHLFNASLLTEKSISLGLWLWLYELKCLFPMESFPKSDVTSPRV
jgi:hypothetical protein